MTQEDKKKAKDEEDFLQKFVKTKSAKFSSITEK